MIEAEELCLSGHTTDGEIAVLNLESTRIQSWNRFARLPTRPGTAELIVEQEQLTAQFTGDLSAFDRLEMLVEEFKLAQPESGRAAFVAAQVACSTHRFAAARRELADAVEQGLSTKDAARLSLGIDQATGFNLHAVLAARRERIVAGRWEELVPLGALLADVGEFEQADAIYRKALREYADVSPFALAWVCFQLGMLWGESVPEPEPQRAAQWYRKAIAYLPCYVKARVHLAEILLDEACIEEAKALLIPALAGGDPEVAWCLADVTAAEGDATQSAIYLTTARDGFEALLGRHLLAFADHGAEFYAGSGNNPLRAFELARINFANRPTRGAFEQAQAMALAAGEEEIAGALLAQARSGTKEQSHAGT